MCDQCTPYVSNETIGMGMLQMSFTHYFKTSETIKVTTGKTKTNKNNKQTTKQTKTKENTNKQTNPRGKVRA